MISKRGFGSNHERAREAAKLNKSRQSPEERRQQAIRAANARWDKRKRYELGYEDITELNPIGN